MRRVKVLLVGDARCGKTSLIAALNGEELTNQQVAVHEDVSLGPTGSVQGSLCVVSDSSSHAQDVVSLEAQISEANVVCIVCSVESRESFEHISTYWIPLIRRVVAATNRSPIDVPILIACNKVDLKSEGELTGVTSTLQSIMQNFEEIDACVECSATANFNVTKLFYFAQKAVLFPRAVLYNTRTCALTSAATQALKRIFRLCDQDHDGALSDSELQEYQSRCFGSALTAPELQGVKEVVRHGVDRGISSAGITQEGFFYLHRHFIERTRLELVWIGLRRFGYNDSLKLQSYYAAPELKQEGFVELSDAGVAFLTELYKSNDTSNGSGLTADMQAQLWDTCPRDPFSDMLLPNPTSVPPLSLSHFLTLWRVMAFENPRGALELFAYLGYGLDNAEGLSVISAVNVIPRRIHPQRTVFRACVLGSPYSGKTTLIKSLGERAGMLAVDPSSELVRTIVAVPHGRSTVTVVISEPTMLPTDKSILTEKNKWDAAVLGYDQHDAASFSYIAALGEQFPTDIRCVVVALKPDLLAIPQDYIVTPSNYCTQHGYSGPISSNDSSGLLSSLATACIDPRREPNKMGTSLLTKIVGVGVVIGALLVLLYTLRRPSSFRKSVSSL